MCGTAVPVYVQHVCVKKTVTLVVVWLHDITKLERKIICIGSQNIYFITPKKSMGIRRMTSSAGLLILMIRGGKSFLESTFDSMILTSLIIH